MWGEIGLFFDLHGRGKLFSEKRCPICFSLSCDAKGRLGFTEFVASEHGPESAQVCVGLGLSLASRCDSGWSRYDKLKHIGHSLVHFSNHHERRPIIRMTIPASQKHLALRSCEGGRFVFLL